MSVSWILYVLVIVQSTQTLNALFPEIDPIDYGYTGSATVTEYILHSESLTWNNARQVCEMNGGTLAKLDTLALHRNIYSVAKAKYNTHIFKDLAFYTSLVFTDNKKVWTTDCSLLTENEPAEGDDKDCFIVDDGHYSFENEECDIPEPFLCQKSTDTPCGETLIISKDIIMQSGKNVTMCSKSCHEDIACWSTIRYPSDMCMKVMYPGYGIETLEMAVKSCIEVMLNETISVGYDDDYSVTAKHNCQPPFNGTQVTIHDLVSPNITGLTPSSASPVQCYNLTETVNVTVVSPTTVSTTVIQPSTVVEISTRYFPATVSAVTTVTVTESLTQTITYNLTSNQLAEVESKTAEIVKNLTVDTKTTSNYVRTLTCAEDSRASSCYIGYVGVLCLVVPLAVIFLSDLRKLVNDFRDAYNGCRR